MTVHAFHEIPSPKLERWKYTNLPVAVKGLDGELTPPDVVFSDEAGVVSHLPAIYRAMPDWLSGLLNEKIPGEAHYKDMALWHMADASRDHGLVVDVPAGKIVDKPVEITINAAAKSKSVPRTLIHLGKNAQLTIIERHEGEGHSWTNALTQIILEPGARLNHYRIQEHDHKAVYTQNTHARIAGKATYETFTITTGAGLSRNQIHAELQGAGGECLLYGVNMLRGQQHGDTTITIEHQAPHCHSYQFYRSGLDDQAHGVFQGKVHVHQIAQKTDGYQLSNALLLSEGAEMDTKPELEIYADDVKCSHGATTGQLNDEALFYMRSRGLNADEARALLIRAFVGEVADKLADKAVEEEISDKVQAWLNRE